MARENNMKKITVEEFLTATKGKQYKSVSSDVSGIFTIIKGEDIPLSFNMDTVENVIAHDNGSFVLDYGVDIPKYTLYEVDEA